MNFQLTLAARYLWGRKLRTFLTTLAVVFGAFVIFGMNILLPTLLAAFEGNIRAASKQVDVSISHKTGEAFALTQLRKVRQVEGVSAAAGSLNRTLNIPDNFYGRSAQVSAVTLIGLDPRAAQTVRDYTVKEGRFLRTDDENVAVITTSLADSVGLKLGDKLRLPTAEGAVKLTIVGLQPARTLPGNEEVLITLSEAQKLLDLPNRINTIEANFDSTDSARREAIQSAIQDELGKDYHLGALSSGSELIASIQTGQATFNLFGFLALCMGGFIIFNTFRTIVAERRHDIGMLRAIGASRGTIIVLFLSEGILQGVIGTAVGMALGYVMGASLVALGAPLYAQFLHLQIGAPVIDPKLIVLTISLGVGVTLVAGLLPAISASRVTPLEALRPAAAAEFSRTFRIRTIVGALLIIAALLGLLSHNISYVALGGLGLLIGLVLVAPALVTPIANAFGGMIALTFAREGTGRLAQGNITRQPSRAAVTASATMIGLAIVVATAGVTTSVTGGFLGVLQKSLGSDYLLMPPSVGVWANNVGASQGLADRLRAVHGVAAVSALRYAQASLGDASLSLLGIDPVAFPQVSALNFQSGDAASAFAALTADRTLIINGPLAAQTKFKVGDDVNLSTPEGVQTYRVVAIAGDYLNAKIATAYTSQANLKTDFHKSDDIFIQLNLTPDADRTAVEAKLKAIVADYPQFKLTSGQAYFAENKQIFDAVFATFYIVLAVLALPSLIALLNTLAIGVIERTREIGMLRAIGATQPQVRRMVMAEALLLSGIGTAFGLVAGLYLGYVMVLGLSATGYPVEYSFPIAGLIAAVAVGLIFGVMAALLPARQAARLEIVRALQYE